MNLTNTNIIWNPDTGRVALVPHPLPSLRRYERLDDGFGVWSTWGACEARVASQTHCYRVGMLYIQAVHMMVGDGIKPDALHKALLPLDEYQFALANDMPGKVKHWKGF